MYTKFFGLNEKPFSITPDPRYLYLTQRHADALAHLLYGISESGGFIQLTGEVGTGKTTLIRSLLEQLPERAKIAVVLNPNLSAIEFLEVICSELHIPLPPEPSTRARIDALNSFLLEEHARNRRVVLIVDEAQTLSVELLEQVRLLTNLETAKRKLLQIILIGQPELRDILLRPDMRQVAQRITGRYHLEPLSQEDTSAYVHHRMKVAGSGATVFRNSALKEIYRRSSGIPRLINVIADRSLLAAYTLDQTRVDGALVRRAAAEVFGRRRMAKLRRWAAAAGIVAAAGLIAYPILRSPVESPEANDTGTPEGAGEVTMQALASDEPPPGSTEAATGGAPAATPDGDVAAEGRNRDGPQTPTLSQLLAQTDAGVDDSNAFAHLFQLWGLEYDREEGSPCSQAITAGLRCLTLEDGSLPQLRRLNRPTVLSLVDDDGRTRYGLLDSLDEKSIYVQLGETLAEMTIGDLTRHWRGEHVLLWEPGTPNARLLVPGERSEGVLWLRGALARVYGEFAAMPAPEEGDLAVYDSELETLVREYQRSHHLDVDGIVGAQTQIALQAAFEDPTVPLLTWSH